jgi:Flp pilus assembly protein CpaB
MSRFTDRIRPRENGRSARPGVLPPPSESSAAPRLRPRERVASSSKTGSLRARLRDPLAIAGIVFVFLALIGYLAVYESGTKHTSILIATHALSAGTVLTSNDLRTGQLAGDGAVLASLAPQRDLSHVLGQRLSSAVPTGSPLPLAVLAGHQAPSSVLVLSVPEFDVIGAGLAAGDRVTVLATFGAGTGQASTRPVARNLEVVSVGEAGPNAQASSSTIPVGVAVSNSQTAAPLALANEDAKLDLLVEGGQGGSTSTIPPASQAGTP